MRQQARTLRRMQQQIESFYGLELAPDVTRFVKHGAADSREVLLVRERDGELELALVLPRIQVNGGAVSSDVWLQMLEGVSHFVYIAERARMGLPATHLELELQAEVDKFVMMALDTQPTNARHLHARLFERVSFLHPPDTEIGERYRLANRLAARFLARTMTHTQRSRALPQSKLREFYRAGQMDKIRLAQAA